MRIINEAKFSEERIRELESAIPDQQNLKNMMQWALSSSRDFRPEVVSQVVIQDEFTHDVVVPWREGLVLVYDTT